MRFHIQQESDIPASTQLYNQICSQSQRGITRRGIDFRASAGDADRLHRNTISKVYRQLETDENGSHGRFRYHVRDQQKPREIKTPPHIRNWGVTDFDREVEVRGWPAECGLHVAANQEPLTREIDQLRPVALAFSSAPRKTSAPRC